MSKQLTTAQVAIELGVTASRVRALIAAGRLPSTLFGRCHMIEHRHIERVRERKPGRPRKS